MSNGFVHSVKVPRIYKVAANIVRRVHEDGAGLKDLIYEKKHPVSKSYTFIVEFCIVKINLNSFRLFPILLHCCHYYGYYVIIIIYIPL